MKAGESMARLMEQLNAAHWLMGAMQKQPCCFAGVSLSPGEAYTLMILADNEGISQTQLCQLLVRTKGATSAMVDRLVEKALVWRQRVQGDQRRYLLGLTPLGHEVSQALRRWKAARSEGLSTALPLPEGDLETASRVLRSLVAYFTDQYQSGQPED